MEQIGQNYGFILYQTVIPLSGSAVNISIPGLRDRGIVFVNQVCEMLDRFFDFHVSDLSPAHNAAEKLKNAALFVRLCLPSELIRFCVFAWTENILKAELFRERSPDLNHTIIHAESTSTPKHFGHRCHISFWTATFTPRKLGVLWRKMARTMPNMCRAVPIF